MIALMAGVVSGAISALALEHFPAIGGAAIVLAVLIFCAALPFPKGTS
jgi:hypothetical protein